MQTNLKLERFLVIGAGRVINERSGSAEHRSNRCRADSVPVFAGYRTVIASCTHKCLRARATSARQALDAARAARERLGWRAILTKPRDLSLHVVPQVSRSSRDPCPRVTFQQGAGFRLEIPNENDVAPWTVRNSWEKSFARLSLLVPMEMREREKKKEETHTVNRIEGESYTQRRRSFVFFLSIILGKLWNFEEVLAVSLRLSILFILFN